MIQAECARLWLDVPADSLIEGSLVPIRNNYRFTISCEAEEVSELIFDSESLRRFLAVADGLLKDTPSESTPQADATS